MMTPDPKRKIGKWHFALCLLPFYLLVSSCSVPNLEKPQCTDARLVVKRFYSYHFGNDMSMSPENLKAREAFLAPELIKTLAAGGESKFDYFTATDRYPKAFRVGTCTTDSETKAVLQVVLLWRDDTRSEQKEVYVDTAKTGDTWLIQKVSN